MPEQQSQRPSQLAIRLPGCCHCRLHPCLRVRFCCCQPRQPASCRFLSENVVQSASLLLSSKSASSSSFCKLSPAIRTEHTALLALTLNCQHQVADHATRGAFQQFKCVLKTSYKSFFGIFFFSISGLITLLIVDFRATSKH